MYHFSVIFYFSLLISGCVRHSFVTLPVIIVEKVEILTLFSSQHLRFQRDSIFDNAFSCVQFNFDGGSELHGKNLHVLRGHRG
ncbi:hypothetical protein BBOR36S_00852 [Brevibacillus borstelensis]